MGRRRLRSPPRSPQPGRQILPDGARGQETAPAWRTNGQPASEHGRCGPLLTARALLAADQLLAAAFGRWSRRLPRAAAADPLDELIECLVNQRTTHAAAGRALAAVRAHYCRWAAVAAAPHDHLADLLRPAGLADMKAGRVQAVLQQVYLDTGAYSLHCLREWDTRRAVRYLLGLPGVGPHTAALVAMFALRRPGVFPVEEGIRRVAERLRWAAPDAGAAAVQRAVEAAGADLDLTDLHVNLIRLGRRHCRADGTECWECPLAEVCPSSHAPAQFG